MMSATCSRVAGSATGEHRSRHPADRTARDVMSGRSSFHLLLLLAVPFLLAAPPAAPSEIRDTDTAIARTAPADKFVDADGIRLHYADWGGQGRVVLFLAGFGDDAHVFDTFAPSFTNDFHAIGLTRRGFGASDKPSDGYDVATRAHDIAALLDAIGVDRVDIVGHSMAGDEMTVFTSLHPDRVDRLVYLDAAYDHSRVLDLMLEDPGTPPLFERMILEARHSAAASRIAVPDLPPTPIWNVLVKTMRGMSAYHIDYSRLRAPALAIYADPDRYPGIEEGTPEHERREMERWWKERQRPSNRANIAQFKRQASHGEVMELHGAPHYLFQGSTQPVVLEKVRSFLLRKQR
jgi:pimeloyl-ACP methyl ester carboxylesterase